MPFFTRRSTLAASLRILTVTALVAVNLSGVLPNSVEPALAAPGVAQTYYTPLEAQDFIDTLRAIQPGASCCTGPVVSTISITSSANGNTVVYDHFEDGYEADPSSPVQASTVTLALDAGDVWTQTSNVPVDLPGRGPGNFFDGHDKIVATRPLAVSHAAYSTTPGTLHAGAVSAYDVNKFGLRFDVPVGENANYNRVFDHVGLVFVASQPGTTVQLDADNNGTFESSFVLAEGETTAVNTGVSLGARVEADKPIGVYVSTGDNSATYEGRFFELFPTETWSASYVTPVGSQDGSTGGTRAFLYNPGLSPITVNRTDGGGGSGAIVVPAQGQASFLLPINQGALFASDDGSPFYATQLITSESTSTSAYDWGFTLVPSDVLAPSFVVPYGPGSGGTPPTRNYSPVWIATLADTIVFVDLDGDPSTGTPDVDGWGYDFTCTVNAYESWTIYDDTNNFCIRPNQSSNTTAGTKDLTGARIYTNDGTKLTAAWGQRPNYTGGSPALDMGVTIFPNPAVEVLKQADISNDLDGDGQLDPGDTLTYTIIATNYGIVDITSVVLTDETPPNTTYVPGSTTVNGGSTADDPGPFSPSPLDIDSPASGLPVGIVLVDGTATVTFDAVLDDPMPFGVLSIANLATLQTSAGDFTATAVVQLDGGPLQIRKTSAPSALPLQSSDSIDYTIQVFNADTAPQTVLVVSDALPLGTTYQPGSVLADIDGLPIAAVAPPTLVSGPTLNPGELLTITFTVDVDASIPAGVTDFTNVATATSDQRGPVSDSAVDPADPRADLRLTKTDSPDPQRAGNQVTYTIQVDNLGPDGAGSVQVVDTLPAGVTFNSTVPGGLCVEAPAGTLTCDLGDQAVGSTSFDVVVDVAGTTAGTVSNSATVSSDATDLVPGNDTDGEDTFILNPSIAITKSTSTPVINSGDSAAYSYTVENTGNEAFAFPAALSIVDDSCAPVSGPTAGDTNSNVILDPGETWTFTCSIALTQDTTNTVTVTATPLIGPALVPTAQADVDVRPTISVTKSAPASIPEPGGTVTFTLDIENTSLEDVTVDAINDSVFGDVLDAGNPLISSTTCVLGATVLPGAANTYSCTFDAPISGDASGPAHTNTATVDASDDEGNTAQDNDPATVTFTNVVPTLTVVKTPSPAAINEPGGVVAFTIDVTNDSTFEAVTLNTLSDDVFGDATAVPLTSCVLPQVLAPGATYSCVFNGTITETAANSPHQNTVTAGGLDNDGSTVTGDDTADVVINDVLPAIAVTKSASPTMVPASGGPVTFTITVANTGVETVTMTALNDDVYGDITDALNPLLDATTCAVPNGIAVAGSYACTFDATPSGAPGATETDTVTATANDDEGNTVNAADSAVVTFGDAEISGVAWLDTLPLAGNSLQDLGEAPIEGLTVELLNDLGVVIATATTDPLGAYLFDGLGAGDYQVRIVPPTGGSFVAQDVGGDDTLDSDVDPTGLTATLTLVASQVVDDLDAGVTPAELTDSVWLDLNSDGARTVGEDGIPGVTVELLDDLGVVVGTTTTDPAGDYLFTGVEPGDYSVRVVYPDATYSPLGPDSDVDPTGQTPATFALVSGPNTDQGDAGIIPATIGDFVWLDIDGDGLQGLTEPGVGSATVNLYDDLGNLVATTSTDAAGAYSFTTFPGDYRVEVTRPDISFTSQDAGGDDTVDSDVDAAGSTVVFTAVSGINNDPGDAGVLAASIVDSVWLDLNDDGIQTGGEPGIEGITVNLYDDLGVLISSTATDATGQYSFTGLVPADYEVEVVPPLPGADFVLAGQGVDPTLDSDVDPISGRASVAAVSGLNTGSADAGVTPGLLTDTVWIDLDSDGVREPGEPLVESVVVNLYDDLGVLVATTTTAVDGTFLFDGLIPAAYEVEVIPPIGALFTMPDLGGDDTVDSDVDAVTGIVAVDVESGTNINDAAAGLLPGSVAGTLWFDDDASGVQEPAESGMSGITVELVDDLGAVVDSAVTLSDGSYLFPGVVPGDYTVRVNPSTIPPLTSQTFDLDGFLDDETPVSLALSEAVVDVDFGYQTPASVAGVIFEDADGDGVLDPGESPLPGVDVTISDSLGNVFVVTTAGDGSYSSPVEAGPVTIDVVEATLPPAVTLTTANEPQAVVAVAASTVNASDIGYQPPVAVSGVVWNDADGDGTRDPGEPELGGIVVSGVCAGPDGILGTGDDAVLPDQMTTGSFTFSQVPVSTCEFTVNPASVPPGLTTPTFDLDGGGDGSAIVVVPTSGRNDVDFGYQGTVDLLLAKSSTEGNVQAGDEAEWVLTVTNVGVPTAIGTITVTDDLPDGLNFISAGGSGWTCAAVGSLVTCLHAGPLSPGDSLEIRILTSVDDDLSGSVNNEALVSLVGDVNVVNNTAVAGIGLLPNTGFNLGDALKWSLLSLVFGSGIILATRRREDDQDLVKNN